MSIYILMYLFILTNTIVFLLFKNKKIERFLFIFTIVSLILIAGTRDNTGVDYLSYIDIFENTSLNLNIRGIEKLFLIIVYISKTILNLDYGKIFLLFSTINFMLLYYFIIKNLNRNLFLALFIWYTFYFLRLDMGQFRYEMAILICLNLVSFLYKNNYIKYCSGVIVSFFIHKTSIIYLSLLFLKTKFMKIKNIIIFFLMSVLLGKIIITEQVLVFTGNLVNSFKLQSMVNGKYISNVGFSFYQIYIILLMIFFYLYKTKNKRVDMLKKIYSLGVCYYFLFINFAIFSDRMSLIFVINQIVLIPMVYEEIRLKKNKITIILFIVTIGTYIFFSNLIKGAEYYIPYKSWLLF